MQNKKYYIQPTIDICFVEPFFTILGESEPKRSGYAIDNTTADDSKIISITEQSKTDLWDEFVDID